MTEPTAPDTRTGALRASAEPLDGEQRLRAVLEQGGHGLWEWDEVGRVSRAPGELLGHGPLDLAAWVALIHPEDLPRTMHAYEEHRAGRTQNFWCEYRARSRSGEWRWLVSRGVATARDASGRATGMIGTITDVTSIHRLQAHALATDRLASVGTLASGVAHEVNNPLACVWANLRLIEEDLARLDADPQLAGAVVPALRGALGEAVEGAARVRNIVRSLQQFARASGGRGREPVDVRGEIEAAVEVTRGEVSHRARLALDVPASLPRVVAIPCELGHVLVNLLVNAARAIPEGRADANEVRLRARADAGRVVVEVADTGEGIPDEDLPRIFDPFFTTRPVGAARGLGLSVCHGIVSGAGGTIEVESAVGRGSCFRVILPVARERDA